MTSLIIEAEFTIKFYGPVILNSIFTNSRVFWTQIYVLSVSVFVFGTKSVKPIMYIPDIWFESNSKMYKSSKQKTPSPNGTEGFIYLLTWSRYFSVFSKLTAVLTSVHRMLSRQRSMHKYIRFFQRRRM